MIYQICKVCKVNKPLTKDYFWTGKNKRNGIEKVYWYKSCKLCDKDRITTKNQNYKRKNRKKLAEKQRAYHKDNKVNDSLTKKKWYQNNKVTVKQKVKASIYNRRKSDPEFRLKENISCLVRAAIYKNRESIKKYLPFTLEELTCHLELKFEPWMTWDNYGTYRLNTWDDNDSSTWTWQIDHIIPHSKFNYKKMSDQEFKDCWALSNLRPYSAKQNIIDGDR